MSRYGTSLALGPPGVCDACGHACATLMEVGNVCCSCDAGIIMHRRWWRFDHCNCHDPWCAFCHGSGVLATPDPDLDVAELHAFWRALPEQYQQQCRPVPDLVRAAAQLPPA